MAAPLTEAAIAELRDIIASGTLRPGDRLPPETELRTDRGIAQHHPGGGPGARHGAGPGCAPGRRDLRDQPRAGAAAGRGRVRRRDAAAEHRAGARRGAADPGARRTALAARASMSRRSPRSRPVSTTCATAGRTRSWSSTMPGSTPSWPGVGQCDAGLDDRGRLQRRPGPGSGGATWTSESIARTLSQHADIRGARGARPRARRGDCHRPCRDDRDMAARGGHRPRSRRPARRLSAGDVASRPASHRPSKGTTRGRTYGSSWTILPWAPERPSRRGSQIPLVR